MQLKLQEKGSYFKSVPKLFTNYLILVILQVPRSFRQKRKIGRSTKTPISSPAFELRPIFPILGRKWPLIPKIRALPKIFDGRLRRKARFTRKPDLVLFSRFTPGNSTFARSRPNPYGYKTRKYLYWYGRNL